MATSRAEKYENHFDIFSNLFLAISEGKNDRNLKVDLGKLFTIVSDCLDVKYIRFIKQITEADQSHHPSYNLSNFPSAWESFYYENQLFLLDPVSQKISADLKKSRMTFGTWSNAIIENFNNGLADSNAFENYIKKIRSVFKNANDYGIISGIYFAKRDPESISILYCASDKLPGEHARQISEKYWSYVYFILLGIENNLPFLTSTTENRTLSSKGTCISLTKMEKEILLWFLLDGCDTIRALSIKRGVPVNTLNFHLKNIRLKFNKPHVSGKSLSTLALKLGLLYPWENKMESDLTRMKQ